jgi:L-lysine 6-oxidase
MTYTYSIYPSIGVARVGNSIHLLGSEEVNFYLAPNEIGGFPIDCDSNGNELSGLFSTFKDKLGMVKRQGQKFRVFRKDENSGEEVELILSGTNDGENNGKYFEVESIDWTVHLANKKAAWYKYSEYKGNLLFGEKNSYEAQKVPKRNKNSNEERQKLIIDPGPRTISGKNLSKEIDRQTIPPKYKKGSFPREEVTYGHPINSLGTLKTDSKGRLIVLGGYGNSGGDEPLSSYGGADTWYDDISDGSVTCTITFKNGENPPTLKALVIVGPPDFAPEIVNISTWDDTMFDVGVRHFDLVPDMYNYHTKTWNDKFQANYQRDILPIIQRISGYHWVANVQSMIAFSSNIFDFSDPSEGNKLNRQKYFSYFRKPEPPDHSKFPDSRQYTLFSEDPTSDKPYIPMMPLNSGSNSVSNYNIEKFLALTQTQYFLLKQWADGKFENKPDYEPYLKVDQRNRASIGNVVGLPQSPGIEVTWTTQNPKIYEDSYKINQKKVDHDKGLSPDRDECEADDGCEPGDLTKRMAIPWQADFFNCSIQYINFNDPDVNKDENLPLPPTYYAYWWPPQAPWDVLGGDLTVDAQAKSHIPAGLQVNYIRGINSYKQMVEYGWSYLGFIRNQNTEQDYGQKFPYMVETERNHDMFDYKSIPVSEITGRDDDKDTEIPVFYLKKLDDQKAIRTFRASVLTKNLYNISLQAIQAEENIFKEIEVEEERQIPRSGTRVRF